MNTITPANLSNLLAKDPGLLVLDVRTPGEYAGMHVPLARNVPLDALHPAALFETDGLLKNRPVYLLCQSGTRAKKAADKFVMDGFENAVVVEGGTVAWIDAGLPVETGRVQVISLERQVRIAAGLLVLLGVALSLFVNRYFIGLSAFVGAGLVFAGITDFCGMGLLLAKLPFNNRKSS